MSKKLEKVNIFPYHISEQPKDKQKIHLLLIAGDEVNEDTDERIAENPIEKKETKYHYCWIKNLDKLLYGQNSKHGGKHTSVIAVYTVLQTKTN